MMIQAVLGNPHHPEYGVATIPFPIPRDQHAHCMKTTALTAATDRWRRLHPPCQPAMGRAETMCRWWSRNL